MQLLNSMPVYECQHQYLQDSCPNTKLESSLADLKQSPASLRDLMLASIENH